eukprot:Rmarinus@m.24420
MDKNHRGSDATKASADDNVAGDPTGTTALAEIVSAKKVARALVPDVVMNTLRKKHVVIPSINYLLYNVNEKGLEEELRKKGLFLSQQSFQARMGPNDRNASAVPIHGYSFSYCF